MVTLARAALLSFALLIIGGLPAKAAPILPGDTTIGAFSWDLDALFGPIFTVENHLGSGFDLTDVLIHATLADSSTLLFDLGTIADGQIAQTFDDLSSPAIDFASLTFTAVFLGTDPISGTAHVAPVTFVGDSQEIVFSTATAPPAPVPEPSTWLLFGGGAALVAWRSRRAARRV